MAALISHADALEALVDYLFTTQDTRERTLVVAGSPAAPTATAIAMLADFCSTVVAVDSGATTLLKAHYLPDVLVGDLDSIDGATLAECQAAEAMMVTASPHKDMSDLDLALTYVEEHLAPAPSSAEKCPEVAGSLTGAAATQPAHEVLVLGIRGGRLDHELCAWGCLAAHPTLAITVVEDDVLAWTLAPCGRAALTLPAAFDEATVSFVSLAANTRVNEAHCEWNLHERAMPPLADLGVSNVAHAGATFSVSSGVAAVLVPLAPSPLGCVCE